MLKAIKEIFQLLDEIRKHAISAQAFYDYLLPKSTALAEKIIKPNAHLMGGKPGTKYKPLYKINPKARIKTKRDFHKQLQDQNLLN